MEHAVNHRPLASKYPILLVYAGSNILRNVLFFPWFMQSLQSGTMHHGTAAAQHKSVMVGLIVGAVLLILFCAVYGYLVRTRSLPRARLVLRVLLGLEIVSLLLGMIKPTYWIVIEAAFTLFTYVVLRLIQDKPIVARSGDK